MKGKLYLAVIALAAMALFNGCAKDGATGPQGPPGADGTNSNVAGTNAITVNWAYNSFTNAYTDTLLSQSLTQDIVNTGSVEVFALYNGSEWWILPDVNGTTVTTYGYGLGYISLQSTDLTNAIPTPPATVRAVFISASARMSNPNTNWKNYKEVKAALHLQD